MSDTSNSSGTPLMDVKKLAYLLVDGYWQVSVLDEVDSTQTYLSQLDSEKLFHGKVVTAEFQSAGRGRLDRTFIANKSLSLLFSFYIEPKMNREYWGWIPLLAGTSVANVLNKRASFFKTKWPNDVLAIGSKHDGKIAGILSEAHGNGVIVGIGINISMPQEKLPVDTATSLFLATGSSDDRNELLADILMDFAARIDEWEQGKDFGEEYIASSSTIGREVKVDAADGSVERGVATGIGSHGELLLDGDRAIYSGDVIHLYT